MRVLTASQVRELFPMSAAIEAMRQATVAQASGRTSVPPRHQLHIDTPESEMLVMSGALHEPATLGVKAWWHIEPPNASARTDALVLLVDPTTGDELLMDGGVLTDIRTGALTGLAVRHLADPDTTVATLVGTGLQARTQALALAEELPDLRTIRVWSRTAERRATFTARLSAELDGHPSITVVDAPDVETAADGAGVVVAATTSSTPVIDDALIAPGTLVCGVGSHDPDSAELAPETVERARLVVVDSAAALVAGDVATPLDRGTLTRTDVAELGEVVTSGTHKPATDDIVVFKGVGFAAADVVAAMGIRDAAAERGLGSTIDVHDLEAPSGR